MNNLASKGYKLYCSFVYLRFPSLSHTFCLFSLSLGSLSLSPPLSLPPLSLLSLSLFPFSSLEDHQLQNDLAAVISERDHLKSSLLETQRERDQSITAMHNLQTVLEHFQKGGNELDELRGLLLKKQEELESANKECQRLLNCQQEKVCD